MPAPLRLTTYLAGAAAFVMTLATTAIATAQEQEQERPQRVERAVARERPQPADTPTERQRAVPRESPPPAPRPAPSGGGGNDTSSRVSRRERSDDSREPADQAVPRGSRPREGRPAQGSAVSREGAPPDRTDRTIYLSPYRYRYPYRSSYYYGYPWYGGYGLGYFYYDPYWWGYPSYGYPTYGYPTYGSYGTYGRYYDEGKLRLRVRPRDAQVFIDGYYVGVVDEFDGVFQRLSLDSGPHRVEITAPGYLPLTFEVRILPGETVTYRGELRRQ